MSLSYTHDSGRWSCSLTIDNQPVYRDNNKSLDPGHTSSYNPSGVPLLGAYHAVKVTLAKGGAAGIVFEGYIGPASVSSGEDIEQNDTLSCECVGILQPLVEFYLDVNEGREYNDRYISASSNVLNQILIDYGFSGNVIIKDDPSYYLYKYKIGDTSIYDAITRPVFAIGYLLMERYNVAAAAFRPTVVDPLRTNYTPDITLGGAINLIRSTYSEANVRTKVCVVYRDRSSGKEARVLASDDAARLKYGVPDGAGGRLHKYIRIVESEGSVIDSRVEAVKEAEAALHDLSSPCPEVEVRLPFLCLGVEGGDLIRCSSRTETVDIGVTGIDLSISEPGDRYGTTTLRGTIAKRVGNSKYWNSRGRTDFIGKLQRDKDAQSGGIPERITGVIATGSWGDSLDGSAAPAMHLQWDSRQDWQVKGHVLQYCKAEETDNGTATGGSTTTLIDSAKTWAPHQLIGRYVLIGTSTRGGNDKMRRIMDNTTNTLSLSEALTTAATNTEAYSVLTPISEFTQIATDKYPFAQLTGLPDNVYIIARVSAIPNLIDK
jgi:hypothetical protein